ncbi:hypothetical protein [Novosphingobium olei]|uniref:Uncharacterized protein n=1 Tax=Novosphingobium olei TaxID=2728851 RepID=A0A7Y0BMB7_9SPHN|nr:hypothetical protein [Novosphingobium olei]NML93049.1 hypothetical protein [Novosphingobium olei]
MHTDLDRLARLKLDWGKCGCDGDVRRVDAAVLPLADGSAFHIAVTKTRTREDGLQWQTARTILLFPRHEVLHGGDLAIPMTLLRGNTVTGCPVAMMPALVGDWRASARQPGVEWRTHGMKNKFRLFRYCGLSLSILAGALQSVYWAVKLLAEVTNYRAKSLRSPF